MKPHLAKWSLIFCASRWPALLAEDFTNKLCLRRYGVRPAIVVLDHTT